MYLLVVLFLLFQTDNAYANNAAIGNLSAQQITKEIENFQDEVAETTDKKLGQTEDWGLKEKIYKAFEKIIQYTDTIIKKLHSRKS